MPTVHRSAIVPYNTAQMYDLVNDVVQYKNFVPWCIESTILNQNKDEIHALLNFSAKGIQKSFSTLNRLQPHRMIEIRLIDGPFKQLEGFWRFEERDNNSSEVILDLEFELSNRLLAMMFGPVFHQVASTLVDAFVNRAKVMYSSSNT